MGAKGIPKEKLQAFVESYVDSWNASQAARDAGYKGSPKVVSESARKLLRRADVRKMIAAHFDEKAAERKATREERQKWWTGIMQGNEIVTDVVDQAGKVRPMKRKPSPQMRMKASELLGKSEGDFVERHEVDVTARVVIVLPDNQRDPPLDMPAVDHETL